jgi:hypothetical protein
MLARGEKAGRSELAGSATTAGDRP